MYNFIYIHSLNALNGNEIWKRLISLMISRNPQDRPTASAVRHYPSFWNSSTLLSFLQVFIIIYINYYNFFFSLNIKI